jgi:hypothetical protein
LKSAPHPDRCAVDLSPQERGEVKKQGSVLGLVDQRLLLDPGHHGAQLGADFLDLVGVASGRGCLERGWPTLFSSIQSRVNLPDWMSLSTRFISALVSA